MSCRGNVVRNTFLSRRREIPLKSASGIRDVKTFRDDERGSLPKLAEAHPLPR